MRPFPAWPTNTFQSPKLATRLGLGASAFLSIFLVAPSAETAQASATRAAAQPAQLRRRLGNAEKIIDLNPLSPPAALGEAGVSLPLPRDRGEIPASRVP